MDKNQRWLSIRQKLMMGYFVLVVIIFFLGGIGSYGIYKVYTNSSMIYNNHLQAVDDLRLISQNLSLIDQDILLMTTGSAEQDNTDYVYDILVLQTENGHLLNDYAQLMGTDISQCRQSVESFDKKVEAILEEIEQGNSTSGYITELSRLKITALKQLDSGIGDSVRYANEKNVENQEIFTRIIIMVVVFCLLAAIAAFGVAFYISNYFTKRLDTIREFAKRMAEYDISGDIEEVPEDELGRTMTALNDSQFMIRDLIEKIISETSAMSEMGTDISNALRKTSSRIQAVNVQVMQSGKMAKDMDKMLSEILSVCKLDTETTEKLRQLLPLSETARDMLIEAMSEMNGITMHLEQIAVTSDYQNEISQSHKERIGRFKLQNTAAKETPQE